MISISSSSDSLESEISSYNRELKISNDQKLNIGNDHIIHNDVERYGSNIPFMGMTITPPGSPIPMLKSASTIKITSHIYLSEFISLILFNFAILNIDIGYYLLFSNITNIYIIKTIAKSIILYYISFLFINENNISYINLHPVFTLINYIFYNYSIIDLLYFIFIQIFTSFIMTISIIYLNYNLFLANDINTTIKIFLPFFTNEYENYTSIIGNTIISYIIFSFIISYKFQSYIDRESNLSRISNYQISQKIILYKCQINFIIILLFGYHMNSSFNITLETGIRLAISLYYSDTFIIMNTINNYSILSIPIKYLLFIEMGICIISTLIGYYLSKKIFHLFRNSFDMFRNSF